MVATSAGGAQFEAEDPANTLNETVVSTARAGSSGPGYVTGFDDQVNFDDSLTFAINVAQGGAHSLTIRYASEFSDKNTRIFVNGADVGEVVLAQSAVFANASGPTIVLNTGANTVTVSQNWGFYDIDYISVALVPPPANMYQAETGTLADNKTPTTLQVANTVPGFFGSGYVTGFVSGNNESVTIPITVADDGQYLITFRYRSEFGEKFTRVSVDGTDTGEWALPLSTTFTTVGGPILALTAGSHNVTIYSNWGFYQMDGILVDFLPPTASDYEAEDGELNGVTVATTRPGFSGTGYVTGFDAAADSVSLLLNLQFSGPHRITVRYAAPFGGKFTRLFIDDVDRGEIELPASTAFADATGPVVNLAAGFHTLELVNNWGFYEIDRVDVDFVLPPVGTQFEAETGTLHQVDILTARAGFSGTGYVGQFASNDASVDLPVNVATGGNYRISLVYASPFGQKFTRLFVNGTDYGETELPASVTFATAPGPIASLTAGLNVITIARNWGFYEVDRLDLELVPPPVFNLAPRPIDLLAAPETVALYRYLRTNFGRTILSGQTEEPTSTPETWHDYIADVTGKLPAVRNLDFLPFTAVDGWNDGGTERATHWHRDLGGIVTYTWHWFAPPTGFAYLTTDTAFDVERAVDPTTPEYQLILGDIDVVAREIGKLAAARVPILFRPLHEAEGRWFWWGAKGPGPVLALYRIMQDRLMNYHGLHNIIWVWNSIGADWYPGNDKVDIVSFDVYRNPGDYALPPSNYLRLAELSQGRKIITLGENGPIPDPDPLAESHTLYSWFNTWWGFWIEPPYNSVAHLREIYDHEKVITLDELDELRAAPAVAAFAVKQYAGAKLELPAGIYNTRALTIRGVVGGAIGSLKVPRGYVIVVFEQDNFRGRFAIFTHDVADLSRSAFRRPVGSAVVVYVPPLR